MIAIAEVLGNVLRKITLDQQDEMTEKRKTLPKRIFDVQS
jgi:hypothetical protein